MLEKEKTCAFTGHRPEKLNIDEGEVKRLLCLAIENALEKGYRTFITGMAKGVDIWAGEIVCDFKKLYDDIHIVAALPYPKFYYGRTNSELLSYKKILSSADFTHISYPSYSPLAYQSRNMWMVDNSSLLIAAFTGSPGGTKNTIIYAKQNDVEIINILN